jgi:hypothetical protein
VITCLASSTWGKAVMAILRMVGIGSGISGQL